MADEYPLNYQQPMQGVPIPLRLDKSDFIEKIKPENIVEVIRHRLMGEEFINDVWVPLPELKDVALSKRGAWEISNMMLAIGSINISISKLNEGQINKRLKNLINEIMYKMLTSWREYNIHDASQFVYVKSIVFSNALGVLFQSVDGSIQNLLSTTISENRLVTSNRKEPGRLKRIIGWGE